MYLKIFYMYYIVSYSAFSQSNALSDFSPHRLYLY